MTPVEEVLQTWRDAERLLDALPALSPDHDDIAMVIDRLRGSYRELTDGSGRAMDVVVSAHRTVEDAHHLLARVKGA